MKKFLKFALLVAAFTNVLTAETIFELSAQHFSNSIEGNGVGARYNLSKTYVSTSLSYVNGNYKTPRDTHSSNFNVEIKNPLLVWSVSFDMSYYLDNEYHPIRFTSDTGKTIIISFANKRIYFNDKPVLDDRYFGYSEEIMLNLSKDGNKVKLIINGDTLSTIDVANFSKLKFVKVSVIHEASIGEVEDIFNGLNIGTSD